MDKEDEESSEDGGRMEIDEDKDSADEEQAEGTEEKDPLQGILIFQLMIRGFI